MGLRGGIVRDAQEFLGQLLEVNSSRVQSDVDERVRESRKKLEAEIKETLHEASVIADSALARARAAQSAGASMVQAAAGRLSRIESEILNLIRIEMPSKSILPPQQT